MILALDESAEVATVRWPSPVSKNSNKRKDDDDDGSERRQGNSYLETRGQAATMTLVVALIPVVVVVGLRRIKVGLEGRVVEGRVRLRRHGGLCDGRSCDGCWEVALVFDGHCLDGLEALFLASSRLGVGYGDGIALIRLVWWPWIGEGRVSDTITTEELTFTVSLSHSLFSATNLVYFRQGQIKKKNGLSYF